MARIVTIKAPTADGTTTEVSGMVARLYVGRYQHKFLLQDNGPFGTCLTDFASGIKVIPSLQDVHLRHAALRGTYTRLTDRKAAKIALDDLVHRVGANLVLERLRAAPALNP